MFRGFISTSRQHIRLWRRRAWQLYSDWTNRMEGVTPKDLLLSNMLLNTGWSMHNSRTCHYAYGMGWMIYLTARSHISQRGSRCTTWTKTGPIFRRAVGMMVAPLFTMPHFVDSTTLRNV